MDENPTENIPTRQYTGKRPPGLTILCVLTFIGSGASAISSLFVAAAYDLMPEAIKQSPIQDSGALLEMINSAGPLFFFITGILYLASLSGAILMFRLYKNGFHLYTTAQLAMLIVPLLMIEGFVLPVANLLLTGSFIMAYAVNIRIMR
ncbi:MAG: hypothetical protein IPH20_22455 [Bacteroidales bacterium]|nr:hypothetical protein [Bacteroidales bacterium]